jgi:trans-2,3-dihydro-3-hydroxyanthranilate isomerase
MFGMGKALVDERNPIAIVSTGIRSLHIPLKSLSHFPDIKPLRSKVVDLCREHELSTVQLFTLETEDPSAHAHARVFAPAVGVDEDPVTGTAAGALGAYLVHEKVMTPTDDSVRLTVEQGGELERHGFVHVEIGLEEADITSVRVGGSAVTVYQGDMRIE